MCFLAYHLAQDLYIILDVIADTCQLQILKKRDYILIYAPMKLWIWHHLVAIVYHHNNQLKNSFQRKATFKLPAFVYILNAQKNTSLLSGGTKRMMGREHKTRIASIATHPSLLESSTTHKSTNKT